MSLTTIELFVREYHAIGHVFVREVPCVCTGNGHADQFLGSRSLHLVFETGHLF